MQITGDGSFYKDNASSRWVYSFFYTGLDGKKNRKKFTGKTKADVRKKFNDFIESNNESTKPRNKNSITVGEYFDYWVKNVKTGSIKEKSLIRLKDVIRLYIKPNLKGVYFTEPTSRF